MDKKHQRDFVPNYFIWVEPKLQEKRAHMMNQMTKPAEVVSLKEFKEQNKKYHDKFMQKYVQYKKQSTIPTSNDIESFKVS